MRVLVKLVPEVRDGLLYMHVFNGTSSACVGPLRDGDSLDAVLESPELPPPVGGVSKRLRKRAQQEERKIAQDIGGRVQPASGAMPGAKGDVRKRGVSRVESKITGTSSYRVTRDELSKIRSECGAGEKPAFVVTFVNKSTLREEDRWVLIPYEDWNEAHINRGSGD